MKKLLSLALFVSFTQLSFTQEITYSLASDVTYYAENIRQANNYIRERCVLDIYYPAGKKDFATVVWFHGGGLTGGQKEIPEALKNKGLCIIGVNYRLNPRAKVPSYIEDAAAAVAWAFNNIGKYGGDKSKIFVSGHSAGGYLACMVGLDKRWLAKHDIDADSIAGLIPFSAQTITHFTIRNERGIKEGQPVVDEYAPLYHVRASAAPLLLITGDRELELLGRYEENAYLTRMMKIAGHKQTRLFELQGYGHNMSYPAFPLLLEEINRILSPK